MFDVKVNYLHFCDAANIDNLGKISILGIFDRVILEKIPTRYPKFTTILNITFKNLNKTKNRLELKLFDSNNTELEMKPPIVVEFTVNEQNKEKVGNINLILDITNLELKSFGKHTLRVIFNNKEIYNKLLSIEEKKG